VANVWLLVVPSGSWLPLRVDQLVELKNPLGDLLASSREELDSVVHLYKLIENTGHQVETIGGPVDSYSTLVLGLTNELHAGEFPKVHLSIETAKASNHDNLREGTHSDGVSELFAELEQWCGVLVIESGSGWLGSRNDNELFA